MGVASLQHIEDILSREVPVLWLRHPFFPLSSNAPWTLDGGVRWWAYFSPLDSSSLHRLSATQPVRISYKWDMEMGQSQWAHGWTRNSYLYGSHCLGVPSGSETRNFPDRAQCEVWKERLKRWNLFHCPRSDWSRMSQTRQGFILCSHVWLTGRSLLKTF